MLESKQCNVPSLMSRVVGGEVLSAISHDHNE